MLCVIFFTFKTSISEGPSNRHWRSWHWCTGHADHSSWLILAFPDYYPPSNISEIQYFFSQGLSARNLWQKKHSTYTYSGIWYYRYFLTILKGSGMTSLGIVSSNMCVSQRWRQTLFAMSNIQNKHTKANGGKKPLRNKESYSAEQIQKMEFKKIFLKLESCFLEQDDHEPSQPPHLTSLVPTPRFAGSMHPWSLIQMKECIPRMEMNQKADFVLQVEKFPCYC